MSRMMLVGWLTLGLFAAVSADVMAQRDSGAKARGEVGRGFWSRTPAYGSFYAGPSLYQPLPGVESYRSFSYEPIAIAPGEEVTINVPAAKLMLGRALVGTLTEGQKFKVARVINGWLGAVVEVDGQTLKGWVWHRNVSPEDLSAAPSARTSQPPVERRSFSYEPVQPRYVQPPRQSAGRRTRGLVNRHHPGRGL